MTSSYSFDDSLQVLGTVLGMKLQKKLGEVTGEAEVVFINPTNVPIKFVSKVVGSFALDGLGVILHISGDLYLLAYRLKANGVSSVYFIDGKSAAQAAGDDWVSAMSGGVSLRVVIKALEPSVRASYYWSGVKWVPLRLP